MKSESVPQVVRDTPVQTKISVVICTRNRGDSVVQTLESVFKSSYQNFEVILVDQSTNQDTEKAIALFRDLGHFTYIHSSTIGKGRACNIGLSNAQGEIIAYTDDDCTAPEDWLEVTVRIFETYPRVALVYFDVEAAPHDHTAGYIPEYKIEKNRLLRNLRDSFLGFGLGAAIALRKEVYLQMGGFDNFLGPGSIFRSGEDRDIAIRALVKDWWVYETNETTIIHYGFRSWEEGIEHTKRDWFSLGATYIKAVKCGYWRASIVLVSAPILRGLFEPVFNLLRFRKPRGFRRWFYYLQGIWEGLRTSTDRQNILYRLD